MGVGVFYGKMPVGCAPSRWCSALIVLPLEGIGNLAKDVLLLFTGAREVLLLAAGLPHLKSRSTPGDRT